MRLVGWWCASLIGEVGATDTPHGSHVVVLHCSLLPECRVSVVR